MNFSLSHSFPVEYTVERTVIQTIRAEVVLDATDFVSVFNDAVESIDYSDIEIDGTTGTLTLEVDLESLIVDAIERGEANEYEVIDTSEPEDNGSSPENIEMG
jgi:hypothetical protein